MRAHGFVKLLLNICRMTFSPKCFNSFCTRWKDDVRAALLQGPGETAHPFLGTSPDSVPTNESISLPRFPPRGKGKDRRHLLGDIRATQLVGGSAQVITQVWLSAQPLPLPRLGSSERATYTPVVVLSPPLPFEQSEPVVLCRGGNSRRSRTRALPAPPQAHLAFVWQPAVYQAGSLRGASLAHSKHHQTDTKVAWHSIYPLTI